MTKGRVKVEGLGSSSIQGDVQFVDILEEMGAEVSRSEEAIVNAPALAQRQRLFSRRRAEAALHRL